MTGLLLASSYHLEVVFQVFGLDHALPDETVNEATRNTRFQTKLTRMLFRSCI